MSFNSDRYHFNIYRYLVLGDLFIMGHDANWQTVSLAIFSQRNPLYSCILEIFSRPWLILINFHNGFATYMQLIYIPFCHDQSEGKAIL